MNDVRDLADCGSLENEYWTHVSPQDALPLAAAAWRDRALLRLDTFIERSAISDATSATQLREQVTEALIADPPILHDFRLITSVSDKRLYLDLSYSFSRILDPTNDTETLCGCAPQGLKRHPTNFFVALLGTRSGIRAAVHARAITAALVITDYLMSKGLATVLVLYARQDEPSRQEVFEKWLMPGETQQNESKRRGHGAEAAIASVLKAVGCSITPPDKDVNPMGAYDPNISLTTFQVVAREAGSTFSADIAIVNDRGEVQAAIMGFVHSSDPGQFGVNKSDQIVQLRSRIDEYNEQNRGTLELWGLLDGVGYSENKAGTIDKMLRNFHYFVQTKSAYKGPLRAHALGLVSLRGISFDDAFYSERTKAQMIERYVPADLPVIEAPDAEGLRPVQAGVATLWLSD